MSFETVPEERGSNRKFPLQEARASVTRQHAVAWRGLGKLVRRPRRAQVPKQDLVYVANGRVCGLPHHRQWPQGIRRSILLDELLPVSEKSPLDPSSLQVAPCQASQTGRAWLGV